MSTAANKIRSKVCSLLDEYSAVCIELEKIKDNIITLRNKTKGEFMIAKTNQEKRDIFLHFKGEIRKIKNDRSISAKYRELKVQKGILKSKIVSNLNVEAESATNEDLAFLLSKYSKYVSNSFDNKLGSKLDNKPGSKFDNKPGSKLDNKPGSKLYSDTANDIDSYTANDIDSDTGNDIDSYTANDIDSDTASDCTSGFNLDEISGISSSSVLKGSKHDNMVADADLKGNSGGAIVANHKGKALTVSDIHYTEEHNELNNLIKTIKINND
jgi:hypothetical protein